APGGERAVRGVRAPAQVEEGLCGLGQFDVRLEAQPGGEEAAAVFCSPRARPGERVDIAVERHRPNAIGVRVRVDGADEGAVGRADEVQRAIAGSVRHQIEIADGVEGGDVREQATAVTLARFAEAAVAVDPGRHLGGPNGKAVDVPGQYSGEEGGFGSLV